MTIRKNFLFEQKIAEQLEEIAKAEGKNTDSPRGNFRTI